VHLLAGLIGAHDDVQQQRQHLASQLQLPWQDILICQKYRGVLASERLQQLIYTQ
jgi:hypothetical protein